MLPKLTSLQYLVLHLLFAGPQTAKQLRQGLSELGVRQTTPSFHRMMIRLIMANLVFCERCKVQRNGQTFHHNRFQVTDFGVAEWLLAQKFHANLAPPSADLVPVETDQGKLAAYPPEIRKKTIDTQFRDEIESTLFALASKVTNRKISR